MNKKALTEADIRTKSITPTLVDAFETQLAASRAIAAHLLSALVAYLTATS